jgi:hypothetical protein
MTYLILLLFFVLALTLETFYGRALRRERRHCKEVELQLRSAMNESLDACKHFALSLRYMQSSDYALGARFAALGDENLKLCLQKMQQANNLILEHAGLLPKVKVQV